MTMNWLDRMVVGSLPHLPTALVWRVAKRYVAGAVLNDAMSVVERLESWGAMATIDVLGEEIASIAEGAIARDEYIRVLDEIARRGRRSNVSIKLTAFGLRLDKDECFRNARAVVAHAKSLGNFVRIDMEDSTTTDDTLAIYRRLRVEGFDNCGVVLQAYMRRSRDDVKSLRHLKPGFRLCKGIYVESAEIAFKGADEIRDNYAALLEDMLNGGSYVGIATHDHQVVERAKSILERRGAKTDAYEFQMLLGVDEALGKRLVQEGRRLRIYVPYGKDWRGYCERRIKENPRIGRYVLFGLFKRG